MPYNRYNLCPTFLKCVQPRLHLDLDHDFSHKGHELGRVIVDEEEAENGFLSGNFGTSERSSIGRRKGETAQILEL